MANTGTGFSVNSGGGLSMPKVRLSCDGSKNIDYHDGNSTVGVITLIEWPEVIAMDLTDEQIEAGVYVEMIHYTRGKGQNINGNNRDSAYKIPVATNNPFANTPTRGGIHGGAAVRFNHYKVMSKNETIPVWEYLHNRLRALNTNYRDINNNGQSLSVKSYNPNYRYKFHGRAKMYAASYSPYYFAFRYITKNDDGTFTSGAITRVIKMQNEDFPFIVDGVASATFNRQVGYINPLFNEDLFRCQFETKLS